MIIVIRNEHEYGPYPETVVANYVSEGKLLMHDKARDYQTGEVGTIETFLSRAGMRPQIKDNGTISQQLARIGKDFIFPHKEMVEKGFKDDRRLMILAIVGLSLSFIMLLPIGGYLMFYAVSLYFATIWGLFFYYCFKTRQVKLKTTVGVFFLTQAAVFIIFSGLNSLNLFYSFIEAGFPVNMIGFILGVGVTEEFAKMVPLIYLIRKTKEPLIPQTLVYYGLMSGIAFGVFEGVQYQTSVNINAEYTTAFVLNIARLTSLPFLHAIWAGIAGYFIASANLYPRYRKSLYTLALAIPAVLHGLYDTFADVTYMVSLLIAVVSVLLLMTYLRKSSSLQQKLRQ